MKSYKMPYIIYADIESLIKKIDKCANNAENLSTAETGEHIPCWYSKLAIWAFDHKHRLLHLWKKNLEKAL